MQRMEGWLRNVQFLDGQTDIHTNTEVHIKFVPTKKSFFTNVLGQLKEYL